MSLIHQFYYYSIQYMILFVAIFALTISVGIYAYTKHNEPNSKVVDGEEDDYHQLTDNTMLNTMNDHATTLLHNITTGGGGINIDEARVRLLEGEGSVAERAEMASGTYEV